jgi:hypothetical protein
VSTIRGEVHTHTHTLIAARLKSLDVRYAEKVGWIEREERNRVRTADFIKAVSWCTSVAIKDALADIAKRTNDQSIKEALDHGRAKTP